MSNTYQVGDLVQVQGTFTDSTGTAFDPDEVTCKYKDPSGNITTDASPTQNGTGIYYVNVEVDESGTWHYRFAGETSGGSYQGADEEHFQVENSAF